MHKGLEPKELDALGCGQAGAELDVQDKIQRVSSEEAQLTFL